MLPFVLNAMGVKLDNFHNLTKECILYTVQNNITVSVMDTVQCSLFDGTIVF
jgi:hypothetical protein